MNGAHLHCLQRAALERPTVVCIAYTVVGFSPVVLLGAQSVQVSRELDFGKLELGLAVGVCWTIAALTAVPLGYLIARAGPDRGLRLSAALSLAALLLIVVAGDWWYVAVAFAVCGLANAIIEVASSVALSGGVAERHQGIAFGAKQAAVPIAALAAGLLAPGVALVTGWRGTFVLTAIPALAFLVAPPLVRRSTPPAHPSPQRPTALLLALAATGFLSGAIGNSLVIFTVDAAVAIGISNAAAGALLGVGSALAMSMRLASGWLVDRRQRGAQNGLILLLALAVPGFLLLTISAGSHLIFTVGILVAFTTGWGWPGLLFYIAVRTHRDIPGPAAGVVLSAVWAGTILGPIAIGYIAEHNSYAQVWVLASAVFGAATATAVVVRWLAGRRQS